MSGSRLMTWDLSDLMRSLLFLLNEELYVRDRCIWTAPCMWLSVYFSRDFQKRLIQIEKKRFVFSYFHAIKPLICISQSDKQIGPSSEHCCMNFMGIVLLWNDWFSVKHWIFISITIVFMPSFFLHLSGGKYASNQVWRLMAILRIRVHAQSAFSLNSSDFCFKLCYSFLCQL